MIAKELTAHILALITSTEQIVVSTTSSIDEPLAATSGDIVAIRGDVCTAVAWSNGLQTVAEAGTLFLCHTPVS